MTEKNFNLVTDPWIKVIDLQGKEQLVSLLEVFENAQSYRQLAGEMKAQDLSILRFLLAILTTVYSRVNAAGEPYEWLKLDDNFQVVDVNQDDFDEDGEDDLLETWSTLWKRHKFTADVTDYLKKYAKKFDFFGEDPFYQVNKQVYNNLVPPNKQINLKKKTGTVALKQINRTISESGNSIAVFTPKSELYKEKADLPEIVRWLITYHNFTGVTDKTKVQAKEKFSVSAGWLYGLNPVFVQGSNLFNQLMLNLDLSVKDEYKVQKPFWEYSDIQKYLTERMKAQVPDNIADLYTTWSRAIHIEWVNDEPVIFSAGLPKMDATNAFIEPMTTWKKDKKTGDSRPATKWLASLGKAMWRDFGQYVQVMNEATGEIKDTQPGIVSWLQELKSNSFIPKDMLVSLATVALISDGNATSQSPAAESFDNMSISAGVLFDDDPDQKMYWPGRIEQTIEITQQVGDVFWRFASGVGNLRNLANTTDFATSIVKRFYASLNNPFLNWLASLTNDEERDPKINEWKDTVQRLARTAAQELLNEASTPDIVGRRSDGGKRITNIFTLYRFYWYSVLKILGKG